ncbi:MAG: hypothetical protein OER85_08285 [Gammaproteobacteria bacterium]|nr:hypothetical protein [Gammaproteobacteria bacterium]
MLKRTLVATGAMLFLIAAGVQTRHVQTHALDQPDLFKTACMQIAVAARKISGLTVRESAGTVYDDKTGTGYKGCRIVADGDGVEYRDDKWPHDILRARMMADEWREDISRAADGAGSTAFAIRKSTALCLFAAAWSISDRSEPETLAASRYTFEVGCFAIKEAGEQAAAASV